MTDEEKKDGAKSGVARSDEPSLLFIDNNTLYIT